MLRKLLDMLAPSARRVQQSEFEFIEEDLELRELIALTYSAMSDWQIAQSRFRSVIDPELIDTAALELEASKMRYTYFLRILKERYPRINMMEQSYL